MCRLFALHAPEPVAVREHLEAFAEISRASKEYQGHGWGCAFREEGTSRWRLHKDIRPIWEAALPSLSETRLLVAHARSAFRNEGIAIENNMPFTDGGKNVFAFNGELRGVRIREHGRIGAEKLFHFARRFEHLGWERALTKTAAIVEKRSDYVRAMNVIASDGDRLYALSRFNEDPEYFTMYRAQAGPATFVSSEPLPSVSGGAWTALENGEVRRLP